MDWLDLLAVQGTLKNLLQCHSSKASILLLSAFFTVQLSQPYMTIGKTIALTKQTLVDKVMSLLLNMLLRLVITFLPRSKHLLISWLQSPSVVVTLAKSKMQYLDAISKMTEWFLFTRQTIHYHVIQVYCPSNNAEDAEFERFYEDLQDFLELTAQIRCPFHYRGLECKSRKSRNTWSNRQIWPWVQNEAQQRLREFCQENTKVMANTLFQ